MKMSKKLLSITTILVLFVQLFSIASFAANNTTNYGSFSVPSSSDYAYWNVSKMVKASGTTTSEIKWMQSSLNYCIKNKGLKASYLDVDGSFGPASKKVTIAFQKKYGLTQDGSFGSKTIAKMKSVLGYNSDSKSTNDKNWMWPCKTQSMSCDFGDTVYHKSWTHRGIDIRASYEDVYASKSGTVYQMGYNSSRGYWLVIDHGNGYYSAYQHLNKYYVKTGTYVKQGTVIAQSGKTGQGTGAHLHFEIMNLGKKGLANKYSSYFSQFNKYVNTNPQRSTKAGFKLNNGKYVSTFSDSKGINYIYK